VATIEPNRIYKGDCVNKLDSLDAGCAQLVFADPPFNIGFTYDTYDDKMEYDQYVDWSRKWIAACKRVLARNGSFFIAIGDEFAAEIRMIGRELGLHLRNWIIWHYSFGQSTKTKFARAHAHIFYFVANPNDFIFNHLAIRVPSARHTEYSDKRANPEGKLPDDVWNDFPRVCGTFKERRGWHGCQMPEQLLARIIRTASNPGDLVIDPFSGSGTTVVTAAKLKRRFLAFDISDQYIAQGRSRLSEVDAAHKIVEGRWTQWQIDTLCSLYRETGTALYRLEPNDVAMRCLTLAFNHRIQADAGDADVAAFETEEVRAMLIRLDKSARLPRLRNDREYQGRQKQSAKVNHADDVPELRLFA